MIKTVGIIGAGQMGRGIAHVFALSGFDVLLCDVGKKELDAAVKAIGQNLDRQIKKKRIKPADKTKALKNIKTVKDLKGLAKCDLVIESIVEDEALKGELFKKLDKILKKDAILASNTSSISITRLAAISGRSGRFLGIHFMNPVPLMELVELIRGIATEDAVFQEIRDLVGKLGKTAVMTEDFPAFVVNRILLPMINEAIYTLYEGVGSVDAIDTAMRLGANHPMGPLELADFIGLDICLSIITVLYEGLADNKYRPCPLLVKYVEAGWLGRKTNRGFYDYQGKTPVPTR
ncbi:MAG: 3-hydroxybutyryl-CoA dehydrogenase [Rhodospirillaceae bacterium]|jgi:3-hydroxybutyryl-CoA dehydrogenase|nr:3-hydroxybutyryl-CoA dehydrogenase [Rhodospirillaceae bacterium]MBT5660353.1 3-hydroxybutyryl-CoA dehydrogenase [Rhodospirillaceae bacterium]MBT5752276.1 3-hydroxybutyryl-CoA dehydrogenase [Rhodospirillaceae bacterium]